MEQLVQDVEDFCDAVEAIPQSVTDRIVLHKTFNVGPRPLSIPATLANIRVFYFVTNKHTPLHAQTVAFEQLRFLLLDKNSNWHDLSDDDKLIVVRDLRLVYTGALVFST